jgi:hypothetical protein
MQSILINIILVAVILIPMAYFMFSNKKNKALIDAFKKKAAEQNIAPGDICALANVVIGADAGAGILCWQSTKGDDLYSIAFSEISDVTVSKSYQNHTIHGAETGTLISVAVSIYKKDKKEVVIPVFNKADGHQIGNDLLDVTEYVSRVKKSYLKH